MERTITIDEKPVRFRCTGRTPAVYRQLLHREIWTDLFEVQNAGEDEKLAKATAFYERIAYTMAKQADDTIPESMEEWLDSFEMFSMYSALPEIVKMWEQSQAKTSVPKKKATRKQTGR